MAGEKANVNISAVNRINQDFTPRGNYGIQGPKSLEADKQVDRQGRRMAIFLSVVLVIVWIIIFALIISFVAVFIMACWWVVVMLGEQIWP